jgi:hypothetical protein
MMLAKFRAAGGKAKWSNLGDDGKFAEAVFSYDGQELKIRYSIEDARKAVGEKKLVDPDSNWAKDCGAMLRARCITKAVRILAPEIIAGIYTPEELDDTSTAKPTRSESELAARRAELLAQQAVANDVIDAEYTSPVKETVSATTAKVEPVETPAETVVTGNAESLVTTAAAEVDPEKTPCTNEQLQELVSLAQKFPSEADNSRRMNLQEIAANVCAACRVNAPNEATMGQINRLITRFRERLSSLPQQ